jgi:hypothetical protein
VGVCDDGDKPGEQMIVKRVTLVKPVKPAPQLHRVQHHSTASVSQELVYKSL